MFVISKIKNQWQVTVLFTVRTALKLKFLLKYFIVLNKS